jgi:D-3-phosphoglycerate dehydrogenase
LRKRILLSEALPSFGSKPALDILNSLGEVVVAPRPTEEVLAQEIVGTHALIVRLARITRPIIDRATVLRVIGRTGTGVDNIDVKAATERGILVVNVPAVNTLSVADHAFSMILALLKRLKDADRALRSNGWGERERIAGEIVDPHGKTLGIVGLGSIGQEVARRARVFGMNVIGYDPYIPPGRANEVGAELADLETLMEKSDVVTIHAALSEETYHLINEQNLRLMKKSAYLVNCARGSIVDGNALLQAINEGWISGAGLDVFEKEPLDQASPLLRSAKVIASPHVAGFTRETIEKTLEILAQDIARAIQGGKPINLVNSEVFTGRSVPQQTR